MKNKKGFNLLATIFILLIFVVLTFTISSFISSDAVIAVKNKNSLHAFYIASTGNEYFLKQLDDDDDWSSPPLVPVKSFANGVFTITTTDESKNRITYTVTGLFTMEGVTYRRAVRPTIQRTAGGLGDILSDYVLYWGGSGGDGSTIGNNATIIGDIFTGSTLEVGNNVVISGDAESSGDIDLGAGSTVEGDIEIEVPPPYDPPTLETTYYDNKLAIAATYPSGNQAWDDKVLSGTTYINGNLTFKNNANISLTGVATVVVTGTVTVAQNVIFGDNITIIAGGQIDIANNVDIGEGGLWYSSIGIEVGNNADVGEVTVGSGTIFITPGDIEFGNNIEYYGFIYCGGDFVQTGNNFYFEGNMIVGGDISIDENSTLVLNPDLVNIEDLIGIGEGLEGVETVDVTGWDEVY